MAEIVVVASEVLLGQNKELLSRFNAKGLVLRQIIFYPLRLGDIASFLNTESKKKALIFTSQNAIFAFHEALKNAPTFLYLKQIPCYAIGHSSARLARELGLNVVFVGQDGHGDKFGDEILPLLHDSKVVYFRAREIVSRLDEKLKLNNIDFKEIIAYESQILQSSILQSQKPKQDSIIIFSAPSHFRAFKNIFTWDLSYRAVAIGETTFKAFDSSIMGYVSEKRDLLSCLRLAQKLLEVKKC